MAGFPDPQGTSQEGQVPPPLPDGGLGLRPDGIRDLGSDGPAGQAAKLFHRLLHRAASWLEGPLRGRRQELKQLMGVALMQHVWRLLDAKNLLQ